MGGTFARTGLPAAVASATYDAANQIATWAGTPVSYDSNGNLTSDGVRTYSVFDRPLDQWLDEAVTIPALGIWEPTRPILVHSCDLPTPFHGDPADQIIVATARHHGAMVVTRDHRIRRYAHVRSLW